ncbi:hypothetical protein GDO81_020905 [Engystomops pustulosus]|uniref:Uncharacterized protein n=1 Tax=Engystomops pustulosus TaxID=76066 RepID=A0AAV6YW83_ENGPU|nr:hypothetical protein GDO81_020905 [Engystomops pustulosus]
MLQLGSRGRGTVCRTVLFFPVNFLGTLLHHTRRKHMGKLSNILCICSLRSFLGISFPFLPKYSVSSCNVFNVNKKLSCK